MNIPAYQSLSLVSQTAAFGVLDYSDHLNDLTSRITGGRVNRNTLAESILNNATDLALNIAGKNKHVNALAEKHTGMNGETLMKRAGVILLGKKDTVSSQAAVKGTESAQQGGTIAQITTADEFSSNVDELLKGVLGQQIKNSNLKADDFPHAYDLLRSLINDHLGKQVVQQFLGTYAQNNQWEALTDKIQSAVVADSSDSIINRLTQAGVRMASGIVHSLVTRGIVENASFNPAEVKPEVKLAANCLNAYLRNDFDCANVLSNYKPSKGILNDELISNVAALTPTLADHMVKRADSALAKAKAQLEAENAHFESDKHHASQLAGEYAAPFDQAENGWEIVGNTTDTDDNIGEFELPKTPAQERAEERVKKAQKMLKNAQSMKEMSGAFKDLMVADRSKKNQERLSGALKIVLKDFIDEGLLAQVTTSVVSQMLQGGEGLPMQNVLGTFIAKYGWENLKTMLDKAVETHLENLHTLYTQTQLDALGRDDPDFHEHTPSWAEMAIPKLASKLAVSHLELYFTEEGSGKTRFDQRGNPHYEMLADVLHAGQELIEKNAFSKPDLIRKSAPIVGAYLLDQSLAAPQYLATMAADGTRQFANAATNYAASAVQTGANAMNTARTIGEGIANNVVFNTLLTGVTQVTAHSLGLARATTYAAWSALGNRLGVGVGLPQTFDV